MNNFHGMIPKENWVFTINLKGNRLEGKLPPSFANYRNLTVLDLGNNKIKDTFKFKSFKFLSYATINFMAVLAKLRIFDVSQNEFVGPLPSDYFHILSAMRNMDRSTMSWLYMGFSVYDDTTEITPKGVDSELPRILKIFAAIYLSDNKFEGEIPKDIDSLRAFQSLNLSHNALAGTIPSSLANLTLLESLHLSSNQLSGDIPQELCRLTFLQMLNLSSNLLTTQIPRGFQFSTFENDSYGGNLEFCGLPLSKKCSDENGEPHDQTPVSVLELFFLPCLVYVFLFATST